MINIYSWHTLFKTLLAGIAFCLPLFPSVLPLLIIMLVIVWSIISFKERTFILLFRNRKLYLLLLLYIFYIVGILYSENVNYGFKDLETKLSFIVFPLIFTNYWVSESIRRKILTSFVAGCLFSMAYNLVHSAYSFYIHYTLNIEYNFYYFLYSNVSTIIHTSYLALYYCIAICIILDFIRKKFKPSLKWLFYFILTSLAIFIFMLSSKAGILSLLVIFGYYLILFLKYFLDFRKVILPASFILVFILLFLFFIPGATTRLMINPEIFSSQVSIEPDTEDSSELRVLVWNSAITIIKNNLLFGVGTGDVKNMLQNEYKARGIVGAIHHNLNAHNQFLQTWMAIGILGFLILAAWLFSLLYYGFRQRDHVLIIFSIIITINFLFESMLETQAGVIFISFFACLLVKSCDSLLNSKK